MNGVVHAKSPPPMEAIQVSDHAIPLRVVTKNEL